MSRPRVLLCEDDAALASILVAFFSDAQIDVGYCTSFEEIQATLRDDPSAIVVSVTWQNAFGWERVEIHSIETPIGREKTPNCVGCSRGVEHIVCRVLHLLGTDWVIEQTSRAVVRRSMARTQI